MSEFRTTIYIYKDGEEYEIPVTVDYDATYDKGDAWTPPEGDIAINSVEPVGEWPDGITLDMASDLQLANIEDEAWEHYHLAGVDDRGV